MTSDEILKKAAEALEAMGCDSWTDEEIARAVLDAVTADTKAEAWDEAVESAYLCENHPGFAVHIEHAPNPYRIAGDA